MKTIRIGKDRLIGDGCEPFIIAEIGNNHNGDMDIARELIRKAKEAGVDAVKFQKKDVETAFAPELLDKPYAGPNSFGATYREHKEALELSADELAELKALADELGLVSFATPFDIASVEVCEQVGYPLYKVASFHVVRSNLIEAVCQTGKPILVSVGMSSLDEIDAAVEVLNSHGSEFVLLQCTSSYPTNVEDMHLRVIPALRERYGCLVGFSCHESGVSISPGTVLMGGCVIERHFTLDRTMKGPDHAASAEPEGMELLVRRARNYFKALGSSEKRVLECEVAARKKFRGA